MIQPEAGLGCAAFLAVTSVGAETASRHVGAEIAHQDRDYIRASRVDAVRSHATISTNSP